MEYKVGDLVKLKKKHTCGLNVWEIIKIGMDVKLRCNKCHHIISLGRAQIMESLVDVQEMKDLTLKTSNIHNAIAHSVNYFV